MRHENRNEPEAAWTSPVPHEAADAADFAPPEDAFLTVPRASETRAINTAHGELEAEPTTETENDAFAPLLSDKLATLEAGLTQEIARRRRTRRINFGLYWAGCASVSAIPLLTRLNLIRDDYLDWWVRHPLLPASSYALMMGVLIVTLRPFKNARKAAGKLALLEDVRTIPLLIDAWNFEDQRLRAVVTEALTNLLPRLQASNADLLTHNQRSQLCKMLRVPADNVLYQDVFDLIRGKRSDWRADLQVAILKAFEQVGDGRCLSIVQSLAEDAARSPGQKRVRSAAQECLPFLQARSAHEQASQTLLRASNAHETGPDVLLRPAVAVGSDANPAQLLRSGLAPE